MNLRRLPIYLLIDCSESMTGKAIDAVRGGIDGMLRHLQADPHALESVFLSSIVFSRSARQDMPLTALPAFRPPKLSTRPGTALGAVLCLLLDSLDREIVRAGTERKGDYKPLAFLLTGGEPTDDWIEAARSVRQARGRRLGELYAIGGPNVDPETLFQLTDAVYLIGDLDAKTIGALFGWLSASISAVLRGVQSSDLQLSDVLLPSAPAGIERVTAASRNAGSADASRPRRHSQPVLQA